MTADLHQLIKADLTHDEGLRLYVYDDGTGHPIKPGSIVKGHPTIGIGRCLDTHGIEAIEADFLIDRDIDVIVAALSEKLAWFGMLDAVRQSVVVEMAFNLGISGLMEFHTTLTAIQSGDWNSAADAMLHSTWAAQVGTRAQRLAARIRIGAAS